MAAADGVAKEETSRLGTTLPAEVLSLVLSFCPLRVLATASGCNRETRIAARPLLSRALRSPGGRRLLTNYQRDTVDRLPDTLTWSHVAALMTRTCVLCGGKYRRRAAILEPWGLPAHARCVTLSTRSEHCFIGEIRRMLSVLPVFDSSPAGTERRYWRERHPLIPFEHTLEYFSTTRPFIDATEEARAEAEASDRAIRAWAENQRANPVARERPVSPESSHGAIECYDLLRISHGLGGFRFH